MELVNKSLGLCKFISEELSQSCSSLSEQRSVTKGSVSNLWSKFDLKNYLTLI